MIRVCLSFIHYPMAIARYFESALRRRSDVELFTVGPYSGTWIPWAGGMQLPAKYAKAPDLPLPSPQNNQLAPLPITYIESQLPWSPDLWLQIDAGWYLRERPNHGKNVIVGTDPHVLNYDAQRWMSDEFYCMQTPYMKGGDKYLPYAFDPVWHSPEEQPQNYDVALIGLHYPQRDQLVNTLRDRGVSVYYDLGPSFDEARALYNQAMIGLNWSSRQDLTARVFELLGMGRLAVVNRVPDLGNFFEDGKDLIGFDSLDEAVEKVLYYRDNPEEARAIADEGHCKVQPHTWDARIEEILGNV